MVTYQPSEAEWEMYGTTFAASRFGSRLVGAALWGIQFFMVISGVSTFLRLSKEQQKAQRRLLIFSAAILATSSLDLGLDIWLVFRNLFEGGPDPRSYVEAYRADNNNESLKRPQIIVIALSDGTIILSEIVLLWRCSVVWGGNTWIIVVPSLACAGSFVARIMSLITLATRAPFVVGTLTAISMASESLSVFVNVMVTGLILFKLRRTWSFVSQAHPGRRLPSMYSKPASRVIESASPLTLFGVCYVTATAVIYYRRPERLYPRGILNAISEVAGTLYFAFCSFSPQIIIFRVLNDQLSKNPRESWSLTEMVPESLRFATADPTTASQSDV